MADHMSESHNESTVRDPKQAIPRLSVGFSGSNVDMRSTVACDLWPRFLKGLNFAGSGTPSWTFKIAPRYTPRLDICEQNAFPLSGSCC